MDSAETSTSTEGKVSEFVTLKSPSLSVIIPTKDRASDLELTVRTLMTQSIYPQQLIIIDQSSQPDARPKIEQLYQRFKEALNGDMKLTYICDPTIGGLTVARNRSLPLSESEIVLFLDDDVVLEPNFLEEIVSVYKKSPKITGVSGVITNYRRPPLPTRIWNSIFLRGPFHDPRQDIYWNAGPLREADPIAVDRFGGGLMSFRSDAIRGCLFDENLVGVCDGEDVDFCVRLPSGSVLLITPRARLVHNQSPSGRLQDHYLRRQARAQLFLYWKNWDVKLGRRFCLWWLLLGFATLATVGSIRRISLAPWRALLKGVREAKQVVETESDGKAAK